MDNLTDAPADGKEKRKPGDIPLPTVLLIGAILMVVSVAAVFLVAKPAALAGPQLHTEIWEYWGDKFHLKVTYNTSEPAIGTKNSVVISRGCTLQINNTVTPGQQEFRRVVTSVMNRSGDIIIANGTSIGERNATIETALYRITAHYCNRRTFFVSAGRYCKLGDIRTECEVV